jgi:hypothetical protein
MGFPWDPSGARASRFSHRDVSGWLEFLPRPNLELAHWRFRTMPNRTHANFKRLAEFACGLTSPATMPCFLRPLPRVQKALGAWAGSCSAAAALLCHASETFLRASHCVRKNPLRAWVVAAGLVSCRPSLLFVSRPEVRVPGVALQRRSGAMRMICAVPSLPGEPNFTSPQTTNQHYCDFRVCRWNTRAATDCGYRPGPETAVDVGGTYPRLARSTLKRPILMQRILPSSYFSCGVATSRNLQEFNKEVARS